MAKLSRTPSAKSRAGVLAGVGGGGGVLVAVAAEAAEAAEAAGLDWVMLCLLARVRWRWVCVSGGVRGFRGRSQGRCQRRFLILVRCLAGRLGRVARRRGRVRL